MFTPTELAVQRRALIDRLAAGAVPDRFAYVTTRVPVMMYQRIDSFAGDQDCNRSEALRRLIARGLKCSR